MARKRNLLGLTAALAIGLVACSDFTSSGDLLNESEAAELAEALVGNTFAGFGSFGEAAPSAAPGQADATISEDFSYTAPCEGGGTIVVAGSVAISGDQSSSSASIEFDYTVAPNGCQLTTTGDKTFTLTGDPNLRARGDLNFSGSDTGGAFEGALNYDGKFTWESSDGRAGACGVDLTANYDFEWGTATVSGTATLEGSVCGVTVTRTVTVEA